MTNEMNHYYHHENLNTTVIARLQFTVALAFCRPFEEFRHKIPNMSCMEGKMLNDKTTKFKADSNKLTTIGQIIAFFNNI